jgi:hypothetical protein
MDLGLTSIDNFGISPGEKITRVNLLDFELEVERNKNDLIVVSYDAKTLSDNLERIISFANVVARGGITDELMEFVNDNNSFCTAMGWSELPTITDENRKNIQTATLETLGSAIAAGAKKVYEFIIKVLKAIRDFLSSMFKKLLPGKIKSLSQQLDEILNTLEKKPADTLLNDARDFMAKQREFPMIAYQATSRKGELEHNLLMTHSQWIREINDYVNNGKAGELLGLMRKYYDMLKALDENDPEAFSVFATTFPTLFKEVGIAYDTIDAKTATFKTGTAVGMSVAGLRAAIDELQFNTLIVSDDNVMTRENLTYGTFFETDSVIDMGKAMSDAIPVLEKASEQDADTIAKLRSTVHDILERFREISENKNVARDDARKGEMQHGMVELYSTITDLQNESVRIARIYNVIIDFYGRCAQDMLDLV